MVEMCVKNSIQLFSDGLWRASRRVVLHMLIGRQLD